MSHDLDDAFAEFFAAVDRRLEAGAKVYGNRSFSRAPAELIREIRDECRDVAAYAFILDCRLAALESAAESLSRAPLVVVRTDDGDGAA
jgi:hypothetical protein